MSRPGAVCGAMPGMAHIPHDESLVHEWRVTQLKRLGIPGPLAQAQADHAGWHQIARLVRRGCSPRLALRIGRCPPRPGRAAEGRPVTGTTARSDY